MIPLLTPEVRARGWDDIECLMIDGERWTFRVHPLTDGEVLSANKYSPDVQEVFLVAKAIRETPAFVARIEPVSRSLVLTLTAALTAGEEATRAAIIQGARTYVISKN